MPPQRLYFIIPRLINLCFPMLCWRLRARVCNLLYRSLCHIPTPVINVTPSFTSANIHFVRRSANGPLFVTGSDCRYILCEMTSYLRVPEGNPRNSATTKHSLRCQFVFLTYGFAFSIKATDFKLYVNIPAFWATKERKRGKHKAQMFALLQFWKSMCGMRNTPFSHYFWAFFECLKSCVAGEYKLSNIQAFSCLRLQMLYFKCISPTWRAA